MVEGAQVTLENAQFVDMALAEASLAIFAADTKVWVKNGKVDGGAQGVRVRAGAHLEADDLIIFHPEVTRI